jgi:hypothetical protein
MKISKYLAAPVAIVVMLSAGSVVTAKPGGVKSHAGKGHTMSGKRHAGGKNKVGNLKAQRHGADDVPGEDDNSPEDKAAREAAKAERKAAKEAARAAKRAAKEAAKAAREAAREERKNPPAPTPTPEPTPAPAPVPVPVPIGDPIPAPGI